MIDKNLLNILACPETQQDLSLADKVLVEKVNAAITQGKVVNRAGIKVTEAIDEGLLRQDGEVLYPVRGQIPVLLVEEGISLKTQKL